MTPDLMSRCTRVARVQAPIVRAGPIGRPRELSSRVTRASSTSPTAASSTSRLSVSFDGFRALNKLSLDDRARRAALHHRAQRRRQDHDDGRHHRQDAARRGHGVLRQHDRPAAPAREPEIARMGIGRKFQKPTVFEHSRVFENLELALKTDKGVLRACSSALDCGQRRPHRRRAAIPSTSRARRRARPALLCHGQKQWLEIGMLLMQDPKLLLLDEPVAGMTRRGDRAHRRAVPVARRPSIRWWSWSTT